MRFRSLTKILKGVAMITVAALSVTTVGRLTASATPIPDGAEVQFTASFISTPGPSTTFSQPAGGDGWTVAHYDGKVYTVFHHGTTLKLVCLVVTTATACAGYPKTVQSLDSSPHDFGTSDYASLHINKSTGTLYLWGTDKTTLTAGVVAIDLKSSNSNPFRSFTALTAAGDAPLAGSGHSGVGNGVFIGSKWYAFNFYAPAFSRPLTAYTPTGDRDKLLCLDMSTGSACPGQPYSVPGLTRVFPLKFAYPGALTPIGTRLILEVIEDTWAQGQTYCLDTATNGACAGTWPLASFGDSLGQGGGFPALDNQGVQIGLCMKVTDSNGNDANFPGNIRCVDKDGADLASQSTAAGAVIDGNAFGGYNANSHVVIGTRVYLAATNIDNMGYGDYKSRMLCFDWANNQSCPNFPVVFPPSDVNQLYTVATDLANPTCLWLTSHGGAKQLQTMDAFTTGSCGAGGLRVLMSNFVQPVASCTPKKYTSLTITSPAPSDYTGGTVTFLDQNGSPLNSLSAQNINSSGVVDLSSLNLSTSAGLPQMVVNLPGAESSDINMTVRWTGAYHAVCDDGGQSVSYTPSPTTTSSGSQATTTTVKGANTGGTSENGVTGSKLPATGLNANVLALVAVVCVSLGLTQVVLRRLRPG